MNIYLVGFMGTGKSSVGKELAKRKKWQFLDLDELIELKEKRLIADIFAKEGEPYFRRIERRTLREVAKEDKFVVSCGGGIVLAPENIEVMKNTGIIICLAASPGVILKRISGGTNRPLLNVPDPKKKIEELLKIRSPLYAKADKVIDTSKLSVAQVVYKIMKVSFSNKSKRIMEN